MASKNIYVYADLQELWKRIVFNICVKNTDGHLRNHGFLLGKNGWKLSPAFDINTVPTGIGLTLNITDEDNSPDTELALEIAEFFRLDTATAKKQLMISKKYTFKLKYRYTFQLISTL